MGFGLVKVTFFWEEELFISLKENLKGHRKENFRIVGVGNWTRVVLSR